MRQILTSTVTRYLSVLTVTVLLFLIAAFTLNALVDPLWYFSGNRFGPVNFAFNERLSKVNLIAGHESEYDCVIFGDSRVTLLPEQKIEGYKCYNFAFSAGKIDEILSYARWLKARNFAPSLIVVGVNANDLRKRTPLHNVPDFVDEGRNPPSPIIEYLSIDVINMSLRSLFGSTPIDRYYDNDFQCKVAVTIRYDPRKPIRDIYASPFNNRAPLEKYRELRTIFPNAQLIGYTPPISAWAIADYNKTQWLEGYTHAIHDVSAVFDRFIDASVPSAITINPANTYDGTHYSSEVNTEIATKLFAEDVSPALNLKSLTWTEMLKVYRQRLNTYSGEIAAGEAAPPDETSPAKDLPAQ